MNKAIPAIIVVAAAIAIVLAVYFIDQDKESEVLEPEFIEPEWNRSGPFSINKNQYKLGEKIFMNVQNLQPHDAGVALFFKPDGTQWQVFSFDGSEKSSFKKYFAPDTSRIYRIYEADQLVGTWNLVFNGTSYEPIQFEILNEYIPAGEHDIEPIPRPNT